MKLFAIYIGGELKEANIELHDMRFVIAPSIGETHGELRRQWWGEPDSLHIDCWAELDEVDGYKITLCPEPFAGKEKLYYLNMGGYDPREFIEKHQNVFVVAAGVPEAKARALQRISHWKLPHRDEMYEADKIFALDKLSTTTRLHLHFEPTGAARPLVFTCKYLPLR
jgi:hypothetical protein